MQAKIKTTGGYTGMENVKLPLTLKAVSTGYGTVDVSMAELIYHGYDFAAGQEDEIKDCEFNAQTLTFIIGSEAEIVE